MLLLPPLVTPASSTAPAGEQLLQGKETPTTRVLSKTFVRLLCNVPCRVYYGIISRRFQRGRRHR